MIFDMTKRPTGITPTGTKNISITQNGTTTEDVTNYASAAITVNVAGGIQPPTKGWIPTAWDSEGKPTVIKFYGEISLPLYCFRRSSSYAMGLENVQSIDCDNHANIVEVDTMALRGLTKLKTIRLLIDPIITLADYLVRDDSQLTTITLIADSVDDITIDSNAFSYASALTTINVSWAANEVSGAPWGATNATINYNYTEA